ncbi:helix-turn-helix domain-containing protein [Hahella sp. KA22]|uniref:GlxA family transcriptional regulator n=1 Tax=Hahella sp. KA22 TaxID=1628392 RepID=UPI000FDF60CF|nr:GlxA family transcriptional regulator [Hahella sp. KA22]AZZ90295.1 GlxA family transcriptional regulator [Hahella sp. KA22]QAY53665.1 helix-turn-helix domain-containing protein [Hahella sp. KA22]
MKIVLLALPHCAAASVHGILDIFTTANYCHARLSGAAGKRPLEPYFNIKVVTQNDQPVIAYNGMAIAPNAAFEEAEPDLIIVASAIEAITAGAALPEHLAQFHEAYEWLRRHTERGAVVASACTGSFVLAEAGLLEGKTVTTHWRAAEHFRQRYPEIRLDIDRLLIDSGDIICAGGATAYIDLSFHLIERFAGQGLATAVSKLHLFDSKRQQQTPYITFYGYKSHKDNAVKKAQEWMESHYAEHFSVDDVAALAGLGGRTFKRRFKEATGENPINYLQQLRVEAVKHQLETTLKSSNEIIWEVGYEDISSFRRLFKRATGCTMEQYRKRFSYVTPPRVGIPALEGRI